MRRVCVICAALAVLLVAGSAEAHHAEYMQVIAEMAAKVPEDRVSCDKGTVTFSYHSRTLNRQHAIATNQPVDKWDKTPAMATEMKDDISIVKPDSAQSMKMWKNRHGFVDTPMTRYVVKSPEIFAVMWCLDLIFTRKEIIYNPPPSDELMEKRRAELLVERRKSWTGDREAKVWDYLVKTAAEVPRDRVRCGPMEVAFSFDKWTTQDKLLSGGDNRWTEKPGKTRMIGKNLIEIAKAGTALTTNWREWGAYVHVNEYVFLVPAPDIFAVMWCTRKGY